MNAERRQSVSIYIFAQKAFPFRQSTHSSMQHSRHIFPPFISCHPLHCTAFLPFRRPLVCYFGWCRTIVFRFCAYHRSTVLPHLPNNIYASSNPIRMTHIWTGSSPHGESNILHIWRILMAGNRRMGHCRSVDECEKFIKNLLNISVPRNFVLIIVSLLFNRCVFHKSWMKADRGAHTRTLYALRTAITRVHSSATVNLVSWHKTWTQYCPSQGRLKLALEKHILQNYTYIYTNHAELYSHTILARTNERWLRL